MVTTRLAEKILSDVKDTDQFVIHNGGQIKNLRELSEAISMMPNSVFHYHVAHDRNDFAEWVRDKVGDWQLADSMLQAESKKEMAAKVRNRQEHLTRVTGEQSIAHEHFMHMGVKEFVTGIAVGFITGMIFALII